MDPADALDLLMETAVAPNLHPYACVDRDAFRQVGVTPPHRMFRRHNFNPNFARETR